MAIQEDDAGSVVRSHKEFVSALQQAVKEAPTAVDVNEGRMVAMPTDDLRSRVDHANEVIRKALGQEAGGMTIEILAGQKEGTPGALRVTHPTPVRIAADVTAPEDVPSRVEFFSTRPREDGVAETRMIGVAKHPDGDGRHSLNFVTERFATRPDENHVIHAELLDGNEILRAAHALAVIE